MYAPHIMLSLPRRYQTTPRPHPPPHNNTFVTCAQSVTILRKYAPNTLDGAVSICKMHIEYGRERHEQRGRQARRGSGAWVPGGRGTAQELAGTGDTALIRSEEPRVGKEWR